MPVRSAGIIRHVPLMALLFVEGILLGQTGIPVEDGGEILTVGFLGGTCHPPGMPLLALLSRCACALAGEDGLRVLFAAAAAVALWALFRRSGLIGWAFAMAILALPPFRERLLQWDAYGLLFLSGALLVSFRSAGPAMSGYLSGLASAAHPQGLFLALTAGTGKRQASSLLPALVLGACLYLLLPLAAASGAVMAWGSPSSLPLFLRQITAAGYVEVYGGRMGLSGLATLPAHLSMLWRSLWPALLVPVAAGAFDLARWNRPLLVRLALLLLADALFVIFVNPMAAGSSQTGWLSLLVFAALCAAAAEALPRGLSVLLAAAVALSAVPAVGRPALPDQQAEVGGVLDRMPSDACLFVADNDLLYGGWVVRYCRDLRPDLALLSPDNFSGWFERMAARYSPGLDLSSGLADVGGVAVGRDSASRALIQLTARDNPGRPVIVVQGIGQQSP